MQIERARAYRIVRTEVEAGRLIRPLACQACGNSPSPAKDGRSKIQAHHHEGYGKPLSVQWLCASCHMAVTPNLNTSNQFKGKTHCQRGHELAGHNVIWQGNWRVCRACKSAGDRARVLRRRALAEGGDR